MLTPARTLHTTAVGVVEGIAGLLAVGVVALFSTPSKPSGGKSAAKSSVKSTKPGGKPAKRR